MKKNKCKNLKDAIKEKEIQLAKLKPLVDKSTVCSDLYNKVVLEKAIMNKELQDLEETKRFTPIINQFKRMVPRKKVLICDYFKSA